MRGLCLLLILTLTYCLAYKDISSLGSLNVGTTQVTVSGLSSGAYMAVQYHIAFSSSVEGIAITAGGPYYCSLGNVITAQLNCMSSPELIEIPALVAATYDFEVAFSIDPISNIKDDKIWLFSGTQDDEVYPGVVRKLEEYYKEWINSENIMTTYDIPAVHSQVTDNYGPPCGVFGSPYIVNCGFDSVGSFLPWILGEKLNPKVAANNSNIFTITQSKFDIIPSAISMGEEAYVYIPTSCQRNSVVCRVHLAFHGCHQGYSSIGDTFIKNAGYNEWAESNNLIILYPQAISSSFVPFNPKGCWDFWGYTDPLFATKSGPQLFVVENLVRELTVK